MMRRGLPVLGLLMAGLTLWFAWQGLGWRPLPQLDAPYTEKLHDARFAGAAAEAGRHLREARKWLGAPALSAAVSIDGKLVWAGVSGWADLETLKPATLDTAFRIGSTSKPLTATALARLVDAGLIDLDKPIGVYVAGLPNPDWTGLTPRQLVSHTAGIPDYIHNGDLRGVLDWLLERQQFPTLRDGLGMFDGSRLLFEPGTGFLYSSFDVNLLGVAMEEAAHEPYLDLMKDWVLRPLGLSRTQADHADRPVADRAKFYRSTGSAARPWREVNHSYKWPSGGLLSTPSDLVRIGGAWFDPGFIRPETVRRFWTPQRLADGRLNPEHYALGWRANEQTLLRGPGWPVFNVHHGGVSDGAFSWLNLYPDHAFAIALTMNTQGDSFAAFMSEEFAITRAFLDRLDTIDRGAAAP